MDGLRSWYVSKTGLKIEEQKLDKMMNSLLLVLSLFSASVEHTLKSYSKG